MSLCPPSSRATPCPPCRRAARLTRSRPACPPSATIACARKEEGGRLSASELEGGGGATRGGEEDGVRATHRMQLWAHDGPRAASARARSARRRRGGECERTSSRRGRSCSPGSTRTCRCRGTACGSLRAVERQRLRLGASESTRERGCTHEGTCCTGCGGKLRSERGGRQRQSIKHLQHEPGAPAPSPHMQLETTHRCRRSCGSAPAGRRGRRRTSGRALRDRIGVSSRAPLRRRRSTRSDTERGTHHRPSARRRSRPSRRGT